MTFLRPAALLLLPALPLLLWIVRRIRFRRPVPATTFLLLARARSKLGTPPRRRHVALRELLRLLPAALAVTALAGPAREEAASAPSVVVLVDRSATMAARAGGGSRIERARARLDAESVGPFRVAGVPPAGTDGEGTAWRATIAEVPATALVRAASERLAAGDRVIVVTDQDLPGLPDEAGVLVVADAATNAGLAACGLDDAGRLLVRIAARGVDPPPFEVVVEDPQGGGAPRALPVPPASGAGRWVFEGVVPPAGGRVRARLLRADANPLDDEVVLVPVAGAPRIGFPAEGHAALWRAFSAQPGAEVFRGEGPCELRVGALNGTPGGRSLLVAPVAEGPWRTGAARAVRGPITGAGGRFRSSTDDLDLPSVHAPPDGAEVLARIGHAPLLVQSGATLVLLQAPELSSWPARESFPLFVLDLLGHLDLRPAAGWRAARGGEPLAFVRAGARAAVLRTPSGAALPVPARDGGRFAFTLEEPGVHELAPEGPAPGPGWPVVVSGAVLSEAESAAAPAAAESYRAPADVRPESMTATLEPIALVLAAAAFLAIEVLPAFRRRRRLTAGDRSRPPPSPAA